MELTNSFEALLRLFSPVFTAALGNGEKLAYAIRTGAIKPSQLEDLILDFYRTQGYDNMVATVEALLKKIKSKNSTWK